MFPSTGKKYSRQYKVPAETEHFVWLARDHTLYPRSWSKWKLPLNRITSGDVQQAKQWTRKLSLTLATKLSLITVCKGRVINWYKINCFSHISTEERAHRYSETRSRSNVSGTYTCWKTLIKLTFSMERLPVDWGWYWNISWLPVLRTDSLNSLAEALVRLY